jgi:hypothetical protein
MWVVTRYPARWPKQGWFVRIDIFTEVSQARAEVGDIPARNKSWRHEVFNQVVDDKADNVPISLKFPGSQKNIYINSFQFQDTLSYPKLAQDATLNTLNRPNHLP